MHRGLHWAFAAVFAAGVIAWAAGVFWRGFDYDEVYHAHVVWLISQGAVPFRDFFVSHPPFAWYPLVVVAWCSPASWLLIALRLVCSLGVLAWLATLVANVSLDRHPLSIRWAMVWICPVLFHPAVLDFAMECRPDAWCYALLFGALWGVRRKVPGSLAARYALFAFLTSLAIAATPKFIVMPIAFAVFDLGKTWTDKRPVAPVLSGYAGGVLMAALLMWGFCRLAGIEPRLAYALGIEYQAVFMQHSGFRYGLLQSLGAHPYLLALVAAGWFAWLFQLIRMRLRPNAFEASLLVFLLLQPLLVHRPYKQYYAVWFLSAAAFLPFVQLIGRFEPLRLSVLVAGILVGGGSAGTSLFAFSRTKGADRLQEFYAVIIELAPPDAAIVAWPPLHPVVRHDTFYGWNRTTDPSGYSTESIMRDLRLPGYSERFEPAWYSRELEQRPPAVVVSYLPNSTSYEPQQAVVLEEYLREHAHQYVLLRDGLLVPVWVHRELANSSALDRWSGQHSPGRPP